MRFSLLTLILLGLTSGLGGCGPKRDASPAAAAPDARLKTQAELDAERDERIQTGVVAPAAVDSSAPATAPLAASGPVAPVVAPPGAVQGDILMVDSASLTVAEVLYDLEQAISELRSAHTPAGFREQVDRLIRRHTQQEIGSLLLFQKAMRGLSDQQREVIDRAADREVERLTALRYDDNAAKLERELSRSGLSRTQLRDKLRRSIVVRQYAREILLPKAEPRRDDLLAYYRENPGEFSSPELRELLMIEAPFAAFLPAGMTWADAPESQQARARLQAVRHIRAAQAALAERSFADVAREFSRGMYAENGGSWGLLGQPLQPPYHEATAPLFQLDEGQAAEPTETEAGWCIVKCGRVQTATHLSFEAAQEKIRESMRERRFSQLLADYVLSLAEKATIVGLDTFVREAVRRSTLQVAQSAP